MPKLKIIDHKDLRIVRLTSHERSAKLHSLPGEADYKKNSTNFFKDIERGIKEAKTNTENRLGLKSLKELLQW